MSREWLDTCKNALEELKLRKFLASIGIHNDRELLDYNPQETGFRVVPKQVRQELSKIDQQISSFGGTGFSND